MTALAFLVEPDRVVFCTDSSSATPTDGLEEGGVSKVWVAPHLDTMMAGNGAMWPARRMGDWLSHEPQPADAWLIAERAAARLREVWGAYLAHAGRTGGRAADGLDLFILGWCTQVDRFVATVVCTDRAPASFPRDGLYHQPHFGEPQPLPAPEGDKGWLDLVRRQRAHERAKPACEGVEVAGRAMLYEMTRGELRCRTLGVVEDAPAPARADPPTGSGLNRQQRRAMQRGRKRRGA